jgi:hypothetical protein
MREAASSAYAKQEAISDGTTDVRALLVVLSTLFVRDALLAAPVLVRDVDDVHDHGSLDTGEPHREKPLHVNCLDTRAHVNWLALSLLVQREHSTR